MLYHRGVCIYIYIKLRTMYTVGENMCEFRKDLINRKKIVVKIGSSSLTHAKTGNLNLAKIEKLVRALCDLKNMGKDVVLVSSGAIAVGKKSLSMMKKPETISEKQACAAVGQGFLIMTYQKIFAEYNQTTAQILMTKDTMVKETSRLNAQNTFNELLKLGVIPIVNENDTISTDEIQFGDNDRLSAVVAALIDADLLILLSDIDGLYTDDPAINKDAKFIELVNRIDDKLISMGKGTSASDVGTGGMSTKIIAARIATKAGADMVIANGNDIENISKIISGENIGTLFTSHKESNFDIIKALS